jgi:hypothetical protein
MTSVSTASTITGMLANPSKRYAIDEPRRQESDFIVSRKTKAIYLAKPTQSSAYLEPETTSQSQITKL